MAGDDRTVSRCRTGAVLCSIRLLSTCHFVPGDAVLLLVKSHQHRAAWLGFVFGLGLFGAGASWVYVSIHEFGFMPAPLAAFLVFLFVAYLALFPALAGWLQARVSKPGVYRLLFAAPVFWVLMEWLRGWLMTGFPWLNLGYSQSDSPVNEPGTTGRCLWYQPGNRYIGSPVGCNGGLQRNIQTAASCHDWRGYYSRLGPSSITLC